MTTETYEFKYIPSTQPFAVDDEYLLYVDGEETPVSVQATLVGGRRFIAGLWDEESGTLTDGAPRKCLEDAKADARKLYAGNRRGAK